MSSQEEFAHLKLPLEDIVEATNNFADENLIGQGGFGKVYKGTLLLSGKQRTNIAARRLHYDYGQGDLEFWNEISMLATLKHENLVSFVGFCNEKGKKIIINEHEVNESLDKYLSSPSLTWMRRLHICVGIARALNYIHCGDGHESSVIHRNIKSSKILLDKMWKPKLSGFEHSKTNTKARRHRLVLADIIGTIGYVDPTYEKTGFVTHKSDVYSFGVVLFEVLCGRRALLQDQREQHSPQYFTEQFYKNGKLDVQDSPQYISEQDYKDGKLDVQDSPQYISEQDYKDGKLDVQNSPQYFTEQFYKDGKLDVQDSPQYISEQDYKDIKLDVQDSPQYISEQDYKDGKLDVQHSPQYFSEQDYKDGKLDVMEKADQIVGPVVQKKRKRIDCGSTSTYRGKAKDGWYGEGGGGRRRGEGEQREIGVPLISIPRYHPKPPIVDGQPSSFFDGQPSSFVDGQPSSFGSRQPSSFSSEELPSIGLLKQLNSELLCSEEESLPFGSEQPSLFGGGEPLLFGSRQPSPFGSGQPSSLFGSGQPSLFGSGQPSLFGSGQSSPFGSRQPSLFVGGEPLFFGIGQPSSFGSGQPSLFGGGEPSLFGPPLDLGMLLSIGFQPPGIHLSNNEEQGFIVSPSLTMDLKHNDETTTPNANVPIPPRKSYSSEEQHFRLQPLFTMKRLDKYLHMPNDELLAQLAKSHYDEENLDDIIDPALRDQMDSESFKIFSETAYNCLKEKRAQRPNIDQILRNLEKSLKLQMRHEFLESSIVAGEVERTPSNRWKGRPSLEHLKIPLIDIEDATKKFTERYLGSGAYGKVYRAELELPMQEKSKGEISRKWRTVAIKCIREDKQGKDGFNAEIELLTSCKHTNIVSLLGFCDEGPNMILVYECASNRSLDNYLGNPDNSINLTWVQRIKIGIDIARGLNYLHSRVEDEQRIIHRDIKSGNILLGKNWVAKIADFGLSRFHRSSNHTKTVYTGNIAGTQVYLCPEYMKTGKLKRAVDIYSFGVVLFEILFGKLANDPDYVEENESGIAHVARRHFEERTIHEMVDPKIMEEVDELTSTLHKGPNQDSLKIYSEIAYRCVAVTQDNRPTANDILEELEKALSSQENNKDNLQMSFEEIKLATQNFSRENLIGGGGFGKVFKGEVTRGNESIEIVAKRLDRSQGQGEHHFLMELEILFEYKHENIIGLEGYCNENHEKIIVYEHASNRSLDRYLNDVSLTWTKRLKICIDIARGLAFLHGGAPTKEMVIHRDIKSANILLNVDWKAKISDFGLSAITTTNQEVVSKLVGTIGYVDPQYEITGFFTEKSDIYSFGVVLFEILYGQLLVPKRKNYDQQHVTRFLKQIHEEEKLGLIVFEDIKEQIDPKSLSSFRVIVSQCLNFLRQKRPTAEEVLQQLEKSLEFQEDYEIWGPKLPEDYEEILKLSKSLRTSYSTRKKKDLYNLLSKGMLLQDDKVWFSLGSNGERNEMISATAFSYRNRSPHDKWCNVPESRFEKVAEMLDISNMMIKIETRTQYLSPNTVYGVYLVFKFCDSRNVSRNLVYVDLKYEKGSKTLHAYFATWRNDEWMMIELYRFLNHKDDSAFEVLLLSLSPYYFREHDAIYIEGIEFRPIDNVEHQETEANSNLKQVLPRPTKSEMISKESINCHHGEELFLLTEMNGKKHLMLSAKAALYNFSDLTLYSLKPSPGSRFGVVLELLPQQMFRISCTIKSQMLSRDADYVCYLVFKLSEKCQELHGPVEVRDLLQNNKVPEIVYFRTPNPWNIHDITRVPKQRNDGWMEVNVWKFNSSHELENDCVFVNLKLISYESSISGLLVCGLEFRPM